jgi:hypothetical protein
MCKILDARRVGSRPTPDRVYVGRAGKWGNRSSSAVTARATRSSRNTAHGSCSSQHSWRRCTNCAARISCAPERCHADVLIELANR